MESELHRISIVKLPRRTAIVILCLNVFLPGFGTFIAGLYGGGEVVFNNLIVGILQGLLSLILVGWIWSIYTGYCIYEESYTQLK